MNIAGIVPQDFIIWLGHAAAVVLVQGCDMRCGYCNRPVLVHELEGKLTDEEALDKISQLRSSISAVVLSGGEPLHQAGTTYFCEKLKKLGLRVALETNGSNPQLLKYILDNKLVDFVALDIKAPFKDYVKFTGKNAEGVKESMRIVISSGVAHEFRTTPIPGIVDEKDIKVIVWNLHGAKRLCLQRFDPKTCLEKSFEKIKPPSIEELVDIASKLEFDGEIVVRDGGNEIVVR